MSKRKVSDLELAAAGFRTSSAKDFEPGRPKPPPQRVRMEDLVAALSLLDQEERAEVFTQLREHYCMNCGAEEKEGERLCQCTNEE